MAFKLDQTHKTFDKDGRQIATDVFSGKTYFRVKPRLSGSPEAKKAEAEALAKSGAVHVPSENSDFAGWWAPLPEAPTAVAGDAAGAKA